MGMGNRKGPMGGSGTTILILLAAGIFFLQGGPARLTALAARPSMVSFVNSRAEAADPVTGILKAASGLQTLSSFIKKQVPVPAQADPAYAAAVREKTGAGEGTGGWTMGMNGPEETVGEGETDPAMENENAEIETAASSQGGTEETGNPEAAGTAGETSTDTGETSGLPAMAATEIRGTVYTKEQLSDFEFVKKSFFYVHKSTTVYPEQLNAEVLLGKDMTIPDSEEPQILLFHTHGSEAYSDSVEGDASMTVVGVGDYLAQLLTDQYGLRVLHVTEVYPYSDSYSMALDMLERTLAENPGIQVTIDLHRDSGGHDVVDINGKPTAPIMFFNGMCQTPEGPLEDVENPYLLDNLAFNFQLKLKAEAYYPGFTLRTFLKAYRYNQHVLPRATLVEVGTENNTFEEARNAMEPLADLLFKVLKGK